jgi:hypothetical protein
MSRKVYCVKMFDVMLHCGNPTNFNLLKWHHLLFLRSRCRDVSHRPSRNDPQRMGMTCGCGVTSAGRCNHLLIEQMRGHLTLAGCWRHEALFETQFRSALDHKAEADSEFHIRAPGPGLKSANNSLLSAPDKRRKVRMVDLGSGGALGSFFSFAVGRFQWGKVLAPINLFLLNSQASFDKPLDLTFLLLQRKVE